VLLVTSPGSAEGAAEVALGLACAMSDMGRRTIAVEADLRTPAFARLLGVDSRTGLADVLDGSATLDEGLVGIGSWTGRGASACALPAGAPAALPQSLLAGPRMRAVVASARQRADVVVLAGSSAAAAGDSLALTALADAVLLVARLDVTRRDEVGRAVQAIDELDGRLVGAVATTGPGGGLTSIEIAHLTRRPQAGPRPDGRPADARVNGSASAPSKEVSVR
jgi:Mrp family chromosome partitioning ATPase